MTSYRYISPTGLEYDSLNIYRYVSPTGLRYDSLITMLPICQPYGLGLRCLNHIATYMSALRAYVMMRLSHATDISALRAWLIDTIPPLHQLLIGYVIIILCLFVNHTFRADFNYTVTDSFDEFMIVRRHKDVPFEFDKGIVKCLD